MNQVINEKLAKTNNEPLLSKKIQKFLGNQCDRCYKHTNQPLKHVMSFNKKVGNYSFIDVEGANYHLKKFCKNCIYRHASTAKIYIEF